MTSQATAALNELEAKLTNTASKVQTSAANVSSAGDVVTAVSVVKGQLLSMSREVSGTVTKLKTLEKGEAWTGAFDQAACKPIAS